MQKFECTRCGKCCPSLPDVTSFGMVVFGFEAKKLKQIAKERDILLDLQPSLALSDDKSKQELVILQKFNHHDCPFYKDHACTIYEDRPILCHAFPIITAGLFSDGEIIKSAYCPGNEKLNLKGAASIKEVIKVYGESYLYCYLFESMLKEVKENLNNLAHNDEIVPNKAKNVYPQLDALEFLSQKELFRKEDELMLEKKTLAETKA